MVNNIAAIDPDSLNAVFSALADPARRQILERLAHGEARIGELGEPLQMTKGAVTKHIKVLERAGLLHREIRGRVHRCELDPAPLQAADRWIDGVRAYWEGRFSALAAYLDRLQGRSDP